MRLRQLLSLAIITTFVTLISCDNDIELTFESSWIKYENGEVVHFVTPDGESVDFTVEYTDQNYLIMRSSSFPNIHIKTRDSWHSMALERPDGTVDFGTHWSAGVVHETGPDPIGVGNYFRNFEYCDNEYRALDRSCYDGTNRWDTFVQRGVGIVTVGDAVLRGDVLFHICQ